MKQNVNVNNRGIDSAGITKDYKEAVAELIWNSFDAKASKVEISFQTNETDFIDSIQIIDNGEGIKINDIDETFGSFLDSKKKKSYQRSSYTRGKKGKGRFSFGAFSGKATWHTTFESDGKFLEFDIIVSAGSKDKFEPTNQKVSSTNLTGTTLFLSELFNVSAYSFTSVEFKEYLAKEFGWFLLLNKSNEFSLKINGQDIEYDFLIGDNEEKEYEITEQNGTLITFKIIYVRWTEKMGDKCYYYLLGSDKFEKEKLHTSFNNNGIGFHHSVYIESSFFDDFIYNVKDNEDFIIGKNQNDPIFKTLKNSLDNYVSTKEKDYIRNLASEKLIKKYEKDGTLPKFSDSKYGAAKRDDLVVVVKEIYSVQPAIFKSLNKDQAKTIVGFLNLLLDSEQRDHILNIIESVSKLTNDERISLSAAITKSNLSSIIKTLNFLEARFKVIELLKKLVFDNSKFSTERDHIQKAVEENYWLFGEQYHICSKDVPFETALANYNFILDGIIVSDKPKIKNQQKQRRMDVFMCQKRAIADPFNDEQMLEENVIVELKRPSVVIGIEQYRQVEDYMRIIIDEPKFNSSNRRWKFFILSSKIDNSIRGRYETMKDKNKKFLVHQQGNYEIYAMSWDDVFTTFDMKHKFLFDKLDYDKAILAEELRKMGYEFNKKGSSEITKEILTLTPESK